MSVSIGSSLPKALLNRKPPISFSGCGFLLPYHFGAALAVKKKSVLLDDIEKIGGCSGGVLMAILSFMEVEEWHPPFDMMMQYLHELRTSCFSYMNVDFSKIYRRIFKILPDNIVSVLQGKLYISLTSIPWMESVIATEFTSKDELMKLIIASSFIPHYTGYIPPKFKGQYHIDGGFSKLALDLGPDTVVIMPFHGSEYGICRESLFKQFPSRDLANVKIDIDPGNVITVANMLTIPTFMKAKEHFLSGYKDASTFLDTFIHSSLLKRIEISDADLCSDFVQKFDQYIKTDSTHIIEPTALVDNLKNGFSRLF